MPHSTQLHLQEVDPLPEATSPPPAKKPKLTFDPLPHARSDCNHHSFWPSVNNASYRINKQGCPWCYCLVCDIRVSQCTSWPVHCMAYFQSPEWQQIRTNTRQLKKTFKIPEKMLPPCVKQNHKMKRFIAFENIEHQPHFVDRPHHTSQPQHPTVIDLTDEQVLHHTHTHVYPDVTVIDDDSDEKTSVKYPKTQPTECTFISDAKTTSDQQSRVTSVHHNSTAKPKPSVPNISPCSTKPASTTPLKQNTNLTFLHQLLRSRGSFGATSTPKPTSKDVHSKDDHKQPTESPNNQKETQQGNTASDIVPSTPTPSTPFECGSTYLNSLRAHSNPHSQTLRRKSLHFSQRKGLRRFRRYLNPSPTPVNSYLTATHQEASARKSPPPDGRYSRRFTSGTRRKLILQKDVFRSPTPDDSSHLTTARRKSSLFQVDDLPSTRQTSSQPSASRKVVDTQIPPNPNRSEVHFHEASSDDAEPPEHDSFNFISKQSLGNLSKEQSKPGGPSSSKPISVDVSRDSPFSNSLDHASSPSIALSSPDESHSDTPSTPAVKRQPQATGKREPRVRSIFSVDTASNTSRDSFPHTPAQPMVTVHCVDSSEESSGSLPFKTRELLQMYPESDEPEASNQNSATNADLKALQSMWEVETIFPAEHIKKKQEIPPSAKNKPAERLLVGTFDLWKPYCSHMTAARVEHALGAYEKDMTTLTKPTDFKIPGTKSEYVQIIAREMGFEFEKAAVLCSDGDSCLGSDVSGLEKDYNYEFLRELGASEACYFTNADKTNIDNEVLYSLITCSVQGNIEVRWELSHHENAKNDPKAFSRFHPIFEKWGSKVKSKVMKERMKWLRSCMLRKDRLQELNSSNCCLLRASIYVIPTSSNSKSKTLIPIMSVLKPRNSSSTNNITTSPVSILCNPLEKKLSGECTTFEAVCKTYRPKVENKTFEAISGMMDTLRQASEQKDGDITEAVPISLAGILSSTAFAVAGEYGKVAPQPDRIKLSLRLYQRESLAWMMDQEDKQSISDPFWIKVQGEKSDKSTTEFYFCPFNGCISTAPPLPSVGGVLAEEMGLGKTLIVTSLICNTIMDAERVSSQPRSAAPITATIYSFHQSPKPKVIRSRGTLIVCPVSLLKQWERELIKTVDPPLKVLCWYGTRSTSPTFIANHDVVLTTYGIFGSGNFEPLLEIEWFRVVMDESTYLKGGGSSCTDSLSRLVGSRRWAVSGTPFGENFKSFRPTLRFLNIIPFHGSQAFEELFTVLKEHPKLLLESYALPRLAYLLKCVLMRHIKAQTLHGQPLVELPPATGHLVKIKQESQERLVYETLESHLVQRAIFDLKSRNGKVGPQSLVRLRTMLLPLRQMASGVRPIPRKGMEEDPNIPTLPEMSGIGAKIKQLLQDVGNEREMDPTAKVVVFAESPSVKQKIQDTLRGNDFDVLTLEGHMTATQRGKILKTFAEDNDAVVLVLSKKVGALGLTLTMANVVVLFEVGLKMSEEGQAVNRIHRIGQTRDVKTLTYVTEDSIDDRTMEIRAQQGQARFFGDTDPVQSKREWTLLEVYRHLFKYES